MTNADIFWLSWGVGLPLFIALGAYIAVRLHERSLRR